MEGTRHRLIILATLAAVAVLAAGPAGGSVAVNLVGKTNYALPMGPGETAGVVPQAGWNNATGSTGSGLTLLDDTGAPTGITLTWRGLASYTGITDAPGNARMMRGCLTPLPGEPITVTLTGLDSVFGGAPYALLVYFDGANGAADWPVWFRIGDLIRTAVDRAGTNFAGALIEDRGAGGNYVRFEHLTGDALTLLAYPAPGSTGGAALNGLQILHAPEPATLALLAAGLGGCFLRRRA